MESVNVRWWQDAKDMMNAVNNIITIYYFQQYYDFQICIWFAYNTLLIIQQ